MNRETYFAELTKELKTLADEDRRNAVAYYAEYVCDAEAASGKEVNVEDMLGSPHTLAAQIKADIAMASAGGFTSEAVGEQASWVGAGTSGAAQSPYQNAQSGGLGASSGAPGATGAQPGVQQVPPTTNIPGATKKSNMAVIWTVILAILAIPVGIPLAIALFATIFSLLIAAFAVIIGFGAAVVGLFVGGVVAAIVGLICLFMVPAVGVFYVGAGLALLGIAFLAAVGTFKLTQLILGGLAKLFNAIRMKLKSKEQAVAQ